MAEPSLAEIIRDKQRQLTEAEALVLRLRNELAEAGHALRGHTASAVLSVTRLKPPGTSTDMAEAVLSEAKQPLHVNDIISGIERHFGASVRYATLVGNISRLVQKNKTFERVGPNRFGLLEWRDAALEEHLFGREDYDATDMSEGVEKVL